VHVNLWCVRRRFAGHALTLDIGVGFTVPAGPAPDGLELFVPVAPEDKDLRGVQDIVPRVREQPAAQLIFGEPVQVLTAGNVTQLSIPDAKYPRPVVLVETEPAPLENVEKADLWRLRLKFRAPLPHSSAVVANAAAEEATAGTTGAGEEGQPTDAGTPGADVEQTGTAPAVTPPAPAAPPAPVSVGDGERDVEYYVRFRIHMGQLGSVWLWKRQGRLLPRSGAIVDLRVSDLRDPVSSGGVVDEARVLDVERVNTFVVAPHWLQQKVAPNLAQARLLEGANWQGYLDRRLNPNGRIKSVVYYWRGSDGAKKDKPANSFIDLGREAGLGWRDYLWLILLASGATAAAAYGPDWVNGIQDADLSPRDAWDVIWSAFDGIGRLLGIAGTVAGVVGLALGVPRRVARQLRRFERERLAKP
jgi:hypothetical protein